MRELQVEESDLGHADTNCNNFFIQNCIGVNEESL